MTQQEILTKKFRVYYSYKNSFGDTLKNAMVIHARNENHAEQLVLDILLERSRKYEWKAYTTTKTELI